MRQASEAPKRKNKRLKKACLHCHSSKKSCSDFRPCRRCEQFGIECKERVPKRKEFNAVQLPSSPNDQKATEERNNSEFNFSTAGTSTTISAAPSSSTLVHLSSSSAAPPLVQHIPSSSMQLNVSNISSSPPLPHPLLQLSTPSLQVNDATLEKLLSDIIARQTQLLQKVQLYNQLVGNSSSGYGGVPLPLPSITVINHESAEKQKLNRFVESVTSKYSSDSLSITIWDRRNMKMQYYNDNAKKLSSLIVRDTELKIGASFLDVNTFGSEFIGGLTIEMIEPFKAGSEPFVKFARWRNVFIVDSMPGVLLQHTLTCVTNEDYFAHIEAQPVFISNPFPIYQASVSGEEGEEGSGVQLNLSTSVVPSVAKQAPKKQIVITKVLVSEFSVNERGPDVHHNLSIAQLFRQNVELIKKLRLEASFQVK